jgi:hypothetical protein
VLGCGKPDRVITIKSPSNSVFYTKETTSGTGPPSADYTRVYAHISNNGVTAKQLVISGEYIENSPITWTSPTDVEICVDQGITDTFRNEVTLITGDTSSDSITIHNHLKEHC